MLSFWIGFGVGLLVFLILLYIGVILGTTIFSIRGFRLIQYLTPEQMGVETEWVEFETSDGITVRGWYVPGDGNLTVIFVHGYLANRCEFVPFAPLLNKRGVGQLYIDTRAHGRTTGTVIGLGTFEQHEVIASIDYCVSRAPGSKSVLVGSSMGGAACIFAAEHRQDQVAAILTDSTYLSLQDAIDGWWSFLASKQKGWKGVLIGKLCTFFLAPVAPIGAAVMKIKIREVRTDTVLAKLGGITYVALVGTNDPIVNPAHAQQMVDQVGGKSRVEVFEGCNHGEARARHYWRFWAILSDLIDEVQVQISD